MLKIIRGLKTARFGFTEMVDAARAGNDVVVLEVGHNRKTETGYRLVKLTDAELQDVLQNSPELNIPKPGIPEPQVKQN